MLLGFQYVMLVAILFYALSAVGLRKANVAAFDEPPADPVAAEV
jgi:hypothetical protein